MAVTDRRVWPTEPERSLVFCRLTDFLHASFLTPLGASTLSLMIFNSPFLEWLLAPQLA